MLHALLFNSPWSRSLAIDIQDKMEFISKFLRVRTVVSSDDPDLIPVVSFEQRRNRLASEIPRPICPHQCRVFGFVVQFEAVTSPGDVRYIPVRR